MCYHKCVSKLHSRMDLWKHFTSKQIENVTLEEWSGLILLSDIDIFMSKWNSIGKGGKETKPR